MIILVHHAISATSINIGINHKLRLGNVNVPRQTIECRAWMMQVVFVWSDILTKIKINYVQIVIKFLQDVNNARNKMHA